MVAPFPWNRTSIQKDFRCWSLHRASLSAASQMPAESTTAPLPWSAWTSGDSMIAGAVNIENKQPNVLKRS